MLTMKTLMRSYPEETAWRIMMRHGSERLLKAQRLSLGLETPPTPRRQIRFTRKADRARVAPTDRASHIIHDTAELFDVQVGEILGETRERGVVLARYAAIKTLRELKRYDRYPMYSTPKIGAIFNRDHATICYALRMFDKYYECYGHFRDNYDILKKRHLAEVKPKAFKPLSEPRASDANAERLMFEAAEIFGVTVKAMRGKSRLPVVRYARWVTMRVLRDVTDDKGNAKYSLPRVGKLLNMHHTSVMHALDNFEACCINYPKVRSTYLKLRRWYVTGDS